MAEAVKDGLLNLAIAVDAFWRRWEGPIIFVLGVTFVLICAHIGESRTHR